MAKGYHREVYDRELIAKLRSDGLTYATIARRVGCTEGTVRRIILTLERNRDRTDLGWLPYARAQAILTIKTEIALALRERATATLYKCPYNLMLQNCSKS